MEVGDLIQWRDRVWIVRKIDETVATAFIEDADGHISVMDQDGDNTGECSMLCNPVRDWPSAPLPFKSRSRLVEVYRGTEPLVKFQDWLKLDEFQIGGSLLLNPALSLGFGDRLIVVHTFYGSNTVTRSPVSIPRNFSSLAYKTQVLQAQIAATPPPPPPVVPRKPNMFDLITDDDADL